MDKLMQIRAFVRIAERASFSAVARELGITQSAVSKAMTALEKSLGTRLLSRSTRCVALTEAGQCYHERCRRILADMEEADAAVSEAANLLVGTLNIAAPVPFGLMFISPRVARFKAQHAALYVNLNLNDQPLDLVEENFDVAIRLGDLNTQGYAARKLGESPFVTVASPGYLAVHGTPVRIEELEIHNCVTYAYAERPQEWQFSKGAKSYKVAVSSNFRSNNLLALKDAAMAGVGIARLPLWMVDAEIKAGVLRPVLENFRQPPYAIHAVYPSSRQIPAKVRLFVDFIKEELGLVGYFLGRRD